MIGATIERLYAECKPGETKTERLPIRVLIRYNKNNEQVFVGLAEDLQHATARVRGLHGQATCDGGEDDDHVRIVYSPSFGGAFYVALAQYVAVTRPAE